MIYCLLNINTAVTATPLIRWRVWLKEKKKNLNGGRRTEGGHMREGLRQGFQHEELWVHWSWSGDQMPVGSCGCDRNERRCGLRPNEDACGCRDHVWWISWNISSRGIRVSGPYSLQARRSNAATFCFTTSSKNMVASWEWSKDRNSKDICEEEKGGL